ncbi:signal peptidase I [Streptosporangium becharense]|uniref:Signal peptidase I n=1 Tax=Streptosporangium becharense TaxID=1816182 RepID=A0A7W9IE05_9ACTN|nr:signal peptidase I [Streptosporangium becharense]MBB2910058.1 signal peptidase I [Streptosporangium becharense]MBB5818987.1 signal peptidase I [Streptosporangium becharense]
MTVDPDVNNNTPDKDDKDQKKGKSGKGGLFESVFLLACGVVVAVLLQVFVFQSFSIPSESMANTLLEGDRVVVNKLHGDAERGDIVVFKGWDGRDTIKRVIAVGGDTVKCCDAQKRITVNGVPLEEKAYLYPEDFPAGEDFEKVVPKGRLWVMGDHRSASADSLNHEKNEGEGTIAEDDVIGRAFAIYWPFSRATVLSTPESFLKVR